MNDFNPPVPSRCVDDGAPRAYYVNNIVIPKETKCIASGSFTERIRSVLLPSGLEAIERDAFRNRIGHVLIPATTKNVAPEAFFTVDTLELYDTRCFIGKAVPFATVNIAEGQGRAGGTNNMEYVVRYSDTRNVKFRVWAPYARMSSKQMIEDYQNAWSGTSFDFNVIDNYFNQLDGESFYHDGNDKLWSAINRLAWPFDLDKTTAAEYREYVKNYSFEALEELAREDDIDRFAVLLECGALTRGALHDMRNIALVAGAQKIIAMIDSAPKRVVGGEKLTKHQVIARACDALDKGESSKIDELSTIASRLAPKERTTLLEHAAANCKAPVIDTLYDMCAPFEYTSRALLVALFSGNTSAARALVKHRADLEGELRNVEDYDKLRKEEQYSHGMIRNVCGRELVIYEVKGYHSIDATFMAPNLQIALAKENGEIESATETFEGHFGRVCWMVANKTSNAKAARTLITISKKTPCEASIATRLLWNFVSFDGCNYSGYFSPYWEKTRFHFDFKNARKILEEGILSAVDIAELPWKTVIDSVLYGIKYGHPGYDIQMLALIKDFAPAFVSNEVFAGCWQPRFAKQDWIDRHGPGTMLLFADVLDCLKSSDQFAVLKALARIGNIEGLNTVTEKTSCLTKRRLKALIEISSEAGNLEATAWLLEQYSS